MSHHLSCDVLKQITREACELLSTADENAVLAFDDNGFENGELPKPYITTGHGSSDLFSRDNVEEMSWSIYNHLFALYG